MSDVIRLRTGAEIEDEAAAWVWRLDAGLSADERQAFEAWLRRDARHRQAFEELGGVWAALDALAEAKRDEKISTFVAPPAMAAARRGRRTWPLAAAALLLILLGAQVWIYMRREDQTMATAVGQQREAVLADGSVVNLNTNTIVETRFTRAARDIRLVKGEAHFKVEKDASRPFRVRVGDTMVQAVGTQFTVRLVNSGDVEVLVSEGRVEVTTPSAGRPALAAPPARQENLAVTARQRVVVDEGAVSIATLDTEAVSRELAWREGAVVLEGEPLSQAVETINRYTEMRLVVTDPEVAQLRVGGRFRTGDVDGFLHALEAALPVRVRKSDNGLVYIEPQR